ncbi:hypothetical protein [Fulvivirga kasyanovii]|uniref:DUF4374 domain-containing protein n=1 Tax=Fulvivirga kasyanovii TaxID=396812 RepID=A0ABW9RKH5_9BACT|nr:hypothetical protein [Fulvivirga kasyanovii]MTI24593.1 hypothetical protein [Fulvivirga kasyanovii]
MKNKLNAYIAFILIMTALLSSCDISDNEIAPDASFFRIYDNDLFQASFIPIDVKQTGDGGYLILGATRLDDSDFLGVYLLKADENGQFVSEQNLSSQFVHPVNSLIEFEDKFYFVAMEATSLQAHLFTLNSAGQLTDTAAIGGNVYYPLYAAADENSIILHSYDNGDKRSVLSLVSTLGQVMNQIDFSIGAGDEVEAPIIEHFTRTGRQLPFSAGKMDNGLYFFNGFYNYTMSLVFTNFSSEDPNGVTQGQHDNGGISAVSHIAGNNFAIARFNYGDNYILPKVELNVTGTTSSFDLAGNSFPELVPDAPVVVKKMSIDGKDISLYGSHTKAGKIILMAYGASSGELLGTKHLGYANPFEIAGFNATEDNGLIVAGATSVADRFTRICLFKLTEDELVELVN